jgi:hypothetical protein
MRPIKKSIVCLANSKKFGGYCIAGKECDGRTWIRPVSSCPTGELSQTEIRLQDGSEPRVLDVIELPLLEPKPHEYQRENWLIAPEKKWKRVQRWNWDDLEQLEDPLAPLWRNG